MSVDLASEMRSLTMDVIGRVLFGIDLAGEAAVGRAVSRLQNTAIAAALLPAIGSPRRARWLAEHVFPGLARASTTLESLVRTHAVVSETMRLCPPAWTIERDAAIADDIAGVEVSAGDTVAISPYSLHRHTEFWPNPEGFDPR